MTHMLLETGERKEKLLQQINSWSENSCNKSKWPTCALYTGEKEKILQQIVKVLWSGHQQVEIVSDNKFLLSQLKF